MQNLTQHGLAGRESGARFITLGRALRTVRRASDATEQLGNVGRGSDVRGASNLERVLELVADEGQFLRAVVSRFDDDPEEPDVADDGD